MMNDYTLYKLCKEVYVTGGWHDRFKDEDEFFEVIKTRLRLESKMIIMPFYTSDILNGKITIHDIKKSLR